MRTTTGSGPGQHAAGQQVMLPDADLSSEQTASAESFAVPGFDAVVRLVTRSLGAPVVALQAPAAKDSLCMATANGPAR